ncbi:hypothetical protein R3X47_23740, partial [Salmonella enterica subsp. enterica serovar Bareilly]|nr:hypothetical protein [Salmonella enterica subsp. enterica serovar Bareilly]
KEICLKILNLHTSTNERTVAYDELYQKIFEVTGVPTSITKHMVLILVGSMGKGWRRRLRR